jgi:hypothetical protein
VGAPDVSFNERCRAPLSSRSDNTFHDAENKRVVAGNSVMVADIPPAFEATGPVSILRNTPLDELIPQVPSVVGVAASVSPQVSDIVIVPHAKLVMQPFAGLLA